MLSARQDHCSLTGKMLSDSLQDWTVNLKQNVSDSFEDYVETRHVYIDRKISPNWAQVVFADQLIVHIAAPESKKRRLCFKPVFFGL